MGETSPYGQLCQALGRKLGAWRSFVVTRDPASVLDALGLGAASPVMVLGDTPIACADIRELGRRAREEGRALVVDNGGPGFAGCAAVRRGAHVSVEPLGEGMTLVGLSRDARRTLPQIIDLLTDLDAPDDAACAQLLGGMPARLARWHALSDAALVVAAYLACHPRIAEVRYPGLKGDPGFEVAARTLEGGFGPWVDFSLVGKSECERFEATVDDAKAQVMRLERALLEGQ